MPSTFANLNAAAFEHVARAIEFIDQHGEPLPSLERVARSLNQDASKLSRLFHKWAGISLKAYIQFNKATIAAQELRQGAAVLETSLDAGLSGPGRLHDLIIRLEAMSPGELARQGAGVNIDFGVADSPFGPMLAARTRRGICLLEFDRASNQPEARRLIAHTWPQAELSWQPGFAAELVERLWPAGGPARTGKICVHVRGTNFQLKVWRALLSLPAGARISYGALATRVGQPTAARAVGAAVGANTVAWLIPCHRVLRESGALGGYRWGERRKRAMLQWEAIHTTH